ncbi:ABC transporter substrate-binding protein [Streptococcus oriscaviae]
MFTKKPLVFSLLAGFILLTSVGIYLRSQGPIVIRLGLYSGSSWDVPNSKDNRAIDLAIAKFEAAHPNVKVVYESGIPKDDYSAWLADSILLGEQTDLFMVPEDDFSLLASTGALQNLTPYLTKQTRSSYYPSALEAGNYQGNYYALPFECNPIMMCVNKDLLDKEGLSLPSQTWTLEDFYEICQAVTKDTDGDGVIDQYGSTDYDWQKALIAYGGDIYDQDKHQLTLATSQMREALSFISKLEALNNNYKVSSDDFDQGKVAFYPMTLAQYRTYKPYPYHVAKYSSFSWTCIQMPAEQPAYKATQVQTSLFAMSSQTSHPDLVWELMTILSQDEAIQQELVNKSQGMSVLKAVMTSQETQATLNLADMGVNSLTLETLNQVMSDSKVTPRFKHYKSILVDCDYLINQALDNKTVDT